MPHTVSLAFFRNITYWLRVVSLGLIVGLSIQFVQAWNAAPGTPQGGNVAGPLTTGNVDQVKNAGLGLTGNLVVGSAATPQSICFNGDCRSVWPTGGSGGTITDYNNLPAGTVAGYCNESITWSQNRAIEPGYFKTNHKTGCACRTGFSQVETGESGELLGHVLLAYFTCIKN